MAIPSVNQFSNQPGGGIVTAMGGINALANNMHLQKINRVKSKYAPLTTQAEAISKLAYANLMGPQFLAKLLQNPGAIANMGDPAAKAALQKVVSAGMGQGTGNALLSLPQGNGHTQENSQQSNNSLSGWIIDKLKSAFHPQQKTNALQQQTIPIVPDTQDNRMQLELTAGNRNPATPSADDVTWDAVNLWARSPKGQAKLAQSPNYIPVPSEVAPYQPKEKTWEQNTGKYLGTIKQGEEAGKFRAQALSDIGKSQLALSGQGAALDEMTKIIANPIWQNARNKIPAFQKQQLALLKISNDPEIRKIAGEFTAAGQSIIANAVAAMGSKHLSREYALAEKQKINDSDTVESSEGKITNAKNLHDIAEKKNNIIKNLLKNGVDEADAVEIANKKVDVSAIRRATDKLLERKVSVTNNKTGETRIMSVSEAQKLGVPNV